jgi:hypothetical protein
MIINFCKEIKTPQQQQGGVMETLRGESAEHLLRNPEKAVQFLMGERRCSKGRAIVELARNYPKLYNAFRRKQERNDLARHGVL